MNTNITKKSTDIDKPEVNIMGRPIKYRPIFKKKALEYLKKCEDEWYQLTKTDNDKGTVFENKLKVELPTVAGLACYLQVSKRSIYTWIKIYPDFLHAIDRILGEQEKRLTNNGLAGTYESKVATALLMANHGIRPDQPETREQSTNITINFVNFTQQGNAVVKEVEKIREME